MPEGTQTEVNRQLRELIDKQQKEIDTIRQILKQNSHNLNGVNLLDKEGD